MLTASLLDHLSSSNSASPTVGVLPKLQEIANAKIAARTAQPPNAKNASSDSATKAFRRTTALIDENKALKDIRDRAQRMLYPIDRSEEMFSLNHLAKYLKIAIKQANANSNVDKTFQPKSEIMSLLNYLYNEEKKYVYEVQAAALILLVNKLKFETDLFDLAAKIAFDTLFFVMYDEKNELHLSIISQLKERFITIVKQLETDKNIKSQRKALKKQSPVEMRADSEAYFAEALVTNDEYMIINHATALLKTCRTLEDLRKKMAVVLNKIDVFNITLMNRIKYEYMSIGAELSIPAERLNAHGMIFQAQIDCSIELENIDLLTRLLTDPQNQQFKEGLLLDLKSLREKPPIYQAFLDVIYEAYTFPSANKSVNTSSISRSRRTIQVFSLDYDGCLATKALLNKLAYISETDIILANRGFFKALIQLMESADENILISGSNRQSPGMDDYNSKKKNVVSSFVTLPAILDYLKRIRPDLNIAFLDYLLLDTLELKPHGTSIKEAPQSGNDPEHSKFPLLYAQMHKMASENPDADIVFNFFDDIDDGIIQPLIKFFNLNKHLIPKNVRLNLNHYEGHAITLLGSIQGEGNINLEYEKTVRDIYKYFEHNSKDTDSLITIKTVIQSSGILSFIFANDQQLKDLGLKKSDQENVIAKLSEIVGAEIRVSDGMNAQAANSSSPIVNPANVLGTVFNNASAAASDDVTMSATSDNSAASSLNYGAD